MPLQRSHEGEQRCRASLQRHSRHRLRLGDCREPGECRDPAGRHVVDGWQAHGQHPHLVEPTDGAGQFGAAAQIGTVTQAVERAGPSFLAGDQQGIKPHLLFARHVAGEGPPESAGGPGADAGHQALESRRPRQQHLLRHQPGGRTVEQHARPVRARPAEGVEPTGQAETDERVGELAVAEASTNSPGVLPTNPALAIQGEASQVCDSERARHIARHTGRHVNRIVQKGAQEPHGAELHGEPQPHVIPAFGRGQFAVGIVEVEVSGELVRAGLTRVAAVPALLFRGQEGDWHLLVSGRAACGRVALPAPCHRRRRKAC